MYRSCLTCTADLGANTVVEDQPVGRRLAFDGRTGRLWVVCPSCSKWNLVPFERRLEAIDDCERLFRDTPTRYATDQIGLAKHASGLTLIRVGKPIGEEFASWRYGDAFRLRHKRTQQFMLGGTATSLLMTGSQFLRPRASEVGVLLALGPVLLASVAHVGVSWATRRRGSMLVHHPRTRERIRLGAGYLQMARLTRDEGESVLRLILPGPKPDIVLRGDAADDTARRVLGKVNQSLGQENDIRDAVTKAALLNRLAPGGGLGEVTGKLMEGKDAEGWRFSGHTAPTMLAVEMHANEAMEERALRGELRLLERQWREADALAGIADDLVLPDRAEPPGKGF